MEDRYINQGSTTAILKYFLRGTKNVLIFSFVYQCIERHWSGFDHTKNFSINIYDYANEYWLFDHQIWCGNSHVSHFITTVEFSGFSNSEHATADGMCLPVIGANCPCDCIWPIQVHFGISLDVSLFGDAIRNMVNNFFNGVHSPFNFFKFFLDILLIDPFSQPTDPCTSRLLLSPFLLLRIGIHYNICHFELGHFVGMEIEIVRPWKETEISLGTLLSPPKRFLK